MKNASDPIPDRAVKWAQTVNGDPIRISMNKWPGNPSQGDKDFGELKTPGGLRRVWATFTFHDAEIRFK